MTAVAEPSPASIATLVAVTREAKRALGGAAEIPVRTFPFKVGSESRSQKPVEKRVIELRLGLAPDLNDVYLIEPPYSDQLFISREHFSIECVDAQFFLVDRGSTCGTLVAGKLVGGNRTGGRTELRDEIGIGTDESPYVFKFAVVRE